MLKGKAGPDYDVEFTARSGWFKRFKDRYSLHNVYVSGTFASVDVMRIIGNFRYADCVGKLLARTNLRYG